MKIKILTKSFIDCRSMMFITDKGEIFSIPDKNIVVYEDGSAEKWSITYGSTDEDCDNKEIKVEELGKIIAMSDNKILLREYYNAHK